MNDVWIAAAKGSLPLVTPGISRVLQSNAWKVQELSSERLPWISNMISTRHCSWAISQASPLIWRVWQIAPIYLLRTQEKYFPTGGKNQPNPLDGFVSYHWAFEDIYSLKK